MPARQVNHIHQGNILFTLFFALVDYFLPDSSFSLLTIRWVIVFFSIPGDIQSPFCVSRGSSIACNPFFSRVCIHWFLRIRELDEGLHRSIRVLTWSHLPRIILDVPKWPVRHPYISLSYIWVFLVQQGFWCLHFQEWWVILYHQTWGIKKAFLGLSHCASPLLLRNFLLIRASKYCVNPWWYKWLTVTLPVCPRWQTLELCQRLVHFHLPHPPFPSSSFSRWYHHIVTLISNTTEVSTDWF